MEFRNAQLLKIIEIACGHLSVNSNKPVIMIANCNFKFTNDDAFGKQMNLIFFQLSYGANGLPKKPISNLVFLIELTYHVPCMALTSSSKFFSDLNQSIILLINIIVKKCICL